MPKPLDPFTQIPKWCTHCQMIVVTHQTICVSFYSVSLKQQPDQLNKMRPITITQKDFPALNTTVSPHDTNHQLDSLLTVWPCTHTTHHVLKIQLICRMSRRDPKTHTYLSLYNSILSSIGNIGSGQGRELPQEVVKNQQWRDSSDDYCFLVL
jgi:hypothetical protein